ncbi:protein-disulfide reductase DsbD domain-containing protein, partial [Pontibacterium sp.]|uniref:protein-disulfide reductase DsbD domain-containing protein n=1 Tax=Pontibacterium sp. TaxID=2036026 RepID=UPI003564EF21
QQLNQNLNSIQYAANGALRAELNAKEDGFILKIRLRNSWHINAEIPGDKRLVGAQVSGLNVDQISYPEGSALNVQFSQDPIEVYSGEFEISGRQTTQDGLLPPRLMFQFQACSDRICLPPERLVMQIPATH